MIQLQRKPRTADRGPRIVAALALAIAELSQAQTPPNIGDALREVAPAKVPAPSPPALPTVGNVPLEPAMRQLPGGGPSVQVRGIQIVGNREIDTPTLLEQLQFDLKGQTAQALTLAELDALATRLTRYYRAEGYFVARVYVPAQQVDDGMLTLRVVEGNYGRFFLENKSRVTDSVVQGLLDDVRRYDIVSLDTLERAMLIVNDTPGAKVVRADVMPGEKVGTSDFAIGTEATPAVTGYALLDNYGSVYSGTKRLTGNIDWNSPSGRGDRLSASGLATDGGGLYNGRLAYSSLIAPNGTRVEAAVARTRYSLGDKYEALGATGTADSLEFAITTPVKRTRASSIQAGISAAARNLRDDVSSTSTVTPKRSYSVTALVEARNDHSVAGFDGLTQANASVTVGRLSFRDAASAALDAAGANTQGTYSRLNLALSRATLLLKGLTLTAAARAQGTLTGRNLDGSERMSVSGTSGVLAYPLGELAGDHAALVRLEVSHALPATGPLQWTASAFTDYGWARAVHPQAAGVGDGRTLGDVGLGLGVSLPDGGIGRLQLAHRTTGGDPVSESASRNRLLLQAGWVF